MIETITIHRRTVFKAVGLAVLTVQCLPLMAHAGENPPSDGTEATDNLIIQSGPGLFHHLHDLLIPYALLQAPPPKGVELTSTEAMFHRHRIVLTRDQLVTVSRGGTITQKASSHLFVIALRQPRP